jgi:hypothetical protein
LQGKLRMAETVEQLKEEIIDRYVALSDDEKDIIGGMVGTQEMRVLGKVLGPELRGIANFNDLKVVGKPKKRGLATR